MFQPTPYCVVSLGGPSHSNRGPRERSLSSPGVSTGGGFERSTQHAEETWGTEVRRGSEPSSFAIDRLCTDRTSDRAQCSSGKGAVGILALDWWGGWRAAALGGAWAVHYGTKYVRSYCALLLRAPARERLGGY